MNADACESISTDRPAQERRRGFSLVELMSVLLILAIASAIVLPQLGGRDDLKVASALREVVADLLYAQNRAIATGKMIYVRFDPARQNFQLLESLDPSRQLRRPDAPGPFDVNLATGALLGVTIDAVSFDGNAVLAFDPTGMPYSVDPANGTKANLDSGRIVLKTGDFLQTISIQPMTGEIRVLAN